MELATSFPLPAEAIYCSVLASARYDVPANIMLAVAETEAGAPGLSRTNTNGTNDVGPMQVNTAYLATLSKYGITPQAVSMSGCYPFQLAAWRIKRHLTLDTGDIWQRAANYHSRTPRHNARYRLKLVAKASLWYGWLSQCAAKSCVWTGTTQQHMAASRKFAAAPTMPPAVQYVPRAISVSATR